MAKSAKDQLGVDLPEPVTPQAVEPPKADDPQRPEWLPENFKDENEFAASYKSAQDKIREQAENQKKLESQLEQLTQVVENFGARDDKTPQAPDADLKERLLAAYENDPIGTIAYLADQAAEQKLQAREEALKEQNDPYLKARQQSDTEMLAMYVDHTLTERIPDWADYREKVGEALTSDPNLIPQSVLQSPQATVEAITRVYKLVKADEILEGAKNGNTSGFVAEQMKQRAQTLEGGGRQQQLDPAEEKMAALKAATKDLSYSAWRG